MNFYNKSNNKTNKKKRKFSTITIPVTSIRSKIMKIYILRFCSFITNCSHTPIFQTMRSMDIHGHSYHFLYPNWSKQTRRGNSRESSWRKPKKSSNNFVKSLKRKRKYLWVKVELLIKISCMEISISCLKSGLVNGTKIPPLTIILSNSQKLKSQEISKILFGTTIN